MAWCNLRRYATFIDDMIGSWKIWYASWWHKCSEMIWCVQNIDDMRCSNHWWHDINVVDFICSSMIWFVHGRHDVVIRTIILGGCNCSIRRLECPITFHRWVYNSCELLWVHLQLWKPFSTGLHEQLWSEYLILVRLCGILPSS